MTGDLAGPDLQQEIDRSFGDGPEHRALAQRIAAGRRTVVRRRVAAAGAVLAVVAVAGSAYAALEPVERVADGDRQVAVDPPTAEPNGPDVPWEDVTPVRYLRGEVQVRAGVEVHQHLVNPYGLEPPELSDAFDLTFEGQRQWVILTREARSGQGLQSVLPSKEWKNFGAFVASQAAVWTGDGRWRDALRLAEDGSVVASPGTTVLQRTDSPRLGEAFAAPGTQTGVAILQPAHSEEVSSVVWRVVDGELETFRVPPDDVVGATFGELLSYVRDRYAAGDEL